MGFRDSHDAMRKERYLKVLPLGPTLEVGDVAMARNDVTSSAQGYLGVREGDRVEVMYVGDDDIMEERGWLYGRCLRHDGQSKQEGWLASSNVCRAPIEMKLAVLPTPARCEVDVVAGVIGPVIQPRKLGTTKALISVPSVGEGYLKLEV